MKRSLLLLLAFLLCIGLFTACDQSPDTNEQTTDPQSEAPTFGAELTTQESTTDSETLAKQTYVPATDTAHFKQHGRLFAVAGGRLGCDHVMSGLEFEGLLYGDVLLQLSVTADTYFTVFIDGERSEQRLYASPTTSELILATFDTPEVHNVRVLKQTESQHSLCTIGTLTVTGELYDAPSAKSLYIEVLGDSITCGYGCLGKPNSENPGGAEWHDGTQTYAALSVLALDADCSVISASGIGISKGFPSFLMQQFYEKTSYIRDSVSGTSDYTFDRVPDAVVINLGTNDYTQGAEEQAYKDGVRALITYIRTVYGKDVPIVWVHNMMGQCRFSWTNAVLEEMGGEQADLYTVGTTINQKGTHGHPDLQGHSAAADKLTAKLKEILQAE